SGAVALANIGVDGADALIRGTHRAARTGLIDPGEDVEMRPVAGALDEALQEQRRHYRTSEATGAGIVHVRNLGIELAVVIAPQRHRPKWVFNTGPCLGNARSNRAIIGINRRKVRAKRDARRARQCRHVNEEVWRLLVSKSQCVGKDQAAFRIGIADFDREASARTQHVAGPEGTTSYGVLDDWQKHAETNRQ